MSSVSRGASLVAVKAAVSVSLVVLLLAWVDTRAIMELFATANVALLLVGALAVIGQTALASLKWAVLLREQGSHAPYLELFRINLASGFINLFAPGTLGGDAYRLIRVRRHTNGFMGALPSVILDRGTGILALVSIGAIGLTTLYFPDRIWAVATTLLVLFTGSYLIVIGPLAALTRRHRSSRTSRLIDDVVVALRPSPRLAAVVGLAFVFQLNTVWICWIYSSAMGISVELPELLVVVPVAYLVEMVPITINGIGLREGALTLLFGQMGLVPEHGLVLGLTISIMRYVAGLPGGMLLGFDLMTARRA